MHMRYYELVGKRVVTADGHTIGRITDLLAHANGDALVVNALLVGTVGLLQRIGFGAASRFPAAPARRIPWTWVARINDTVQLRVRATEIDRARIHESADEASAGAAGQVAWE